MHRSKQNTLSRRGFIKKSTAAALTLGITGPAIIIPGRARQKTLKILKWKHFVPGFENWFSENYVIEWGEKNGIKVIVENVGLGEIAGRAAAQVQSGKGHDLVLLLTPAHAYEDSLIDHREIFEESVQKYGQPTTAAYKTCYNPETGRHNGFCTGLIPSLVTYRKDLWDAIDMAPDSWDAVRRGGRQIKLLQDQPVGISLAPEHNSEHSLRAIMYSFGSSVQDIDGKPSLKSSATLEALKYTSSLFEQAMPREVLGWNAVSNNRFMLSAEGCLTLDTLSIVRAAEGKAMPAGDNLRLAKLPQGPAGGLGPAFGVDNYIIWKFAENPEGARQFLVDYVGQLRAGFVASGFQHMPSFPGAVPDLEQLVTADSNATVADQYSLLKDASDWVTNIGYPGFANPAIEEILNTRLISKMFAAVATGALTAEAAMTQAHRQAGSIFEKWA